MSAKMFFDPSHLREGIFFATNNKMRQDFGRVGNALLSFVDRVKGTDQVIFISLEDFARLLHGQIVSGAILETRGSNFGSAGLIFRASEFGGDYNRVSELFSLFIGGEHFERPADLPPPRRNRPVFMQGDNGEVTYSWVPTDVKLTDNPPGNQIFPVATLPKEYGMAAYRMLPTLVRTILDRYEMPDVDGLTQAIRDAAGVARHNSPRSVKG